VNCLICLLYLLRFLSLATINDTAWHTHIPCVTEANSNIKQNMATVCKRTYCHNYKHFVV